MAVLLKGGMLVAILGVAMLRVTYAETAEPPPYGNLKISGSDAVENTRTLRTRQSDLPLLTASTLNRESEREASPFLLIPQTRSTAPSPLLTRSSRTNPAEPHTTDAPYGRLEQQPSSLRLILAPNREKQQAASRPHEAVRETSVSPAEQGQNNEGRPAQKAETSAGNRALAWEISPNDKTLNATLVRWSASAGWQLVWDVDVDYPIETHAVLEGTFQEAVATVAESLARASLPVQAIFYEGNRVLRIVAKGGK